MDQERIGRFMASLRREKGMTQEELGERLGVTSRMVSRWETGRNMPDVGMLGELAGILGITADELLAGARREAAAPEGAKEAALRSVREETAFALEERMAYFRRKWLREHRGTLVLWSLLWAAGLGFAAGKREPVGIAAAVCAGCGIYGCLRNRMMAYVEKRTFGPEGCGGACDRSGPLV